MSPLLPKLNEIQKAAKMLAPYIVRTPLLRLNDPGSGNDIYLKLENLQPMGAFKARCMGYALLCTSQTQRCNGVYTASSGNAGLGLAWMAQQLKITSTVYVPHNAPRAKLDAIRSYGAKVQEIDHPNWWKIIQQNGHVEDPGTYIDAVRSTAALAGNATIGLEILEDIRNVDTVIVPFGGGGLACGISTALRESSSKAKVLAAECDTATPLTSAFEAKRPIEVETKPSFISGAGAPCVLQEMWPLLNNLIDGTLLTTVTATKAAVRFLAEHNQLIVEGAGAIPVACAMSNPTNLGTIVCIVSGGNIDPTIMANLLQG